MEHRAPRLPEITLENVTLDVFAVDKRDLLHFLCRKEQMSDVEAERTLAEATELASLVEDICRFHHRLVRDIRKTSRSPESTPILDYLHGIRFQVLCDADLVKKHLKERKLGRHFPHTRRKISKRLARLATANIMGKPVETLSASPPQQPDLASLPVELLQQITSPLLWSAQIAGKMDFAGHTLKDLRARYSDIYKKT